MSVNVKNRNHRKMQISTFHLKSFLFLSNKTEPCFTGLHFTDKFLTASSVVYWGLRNDFDACCSWSCLSGTFVKSFGKRFSKEPWKTVFQKIWKRLFQKPWTTVLQKTGIAKNNLK